MHAVKLLGDLEVQLHALLILAQDGGESSVFHPGRFNSRETAPLRTD